jgi:cytochrome c oxidase subunit II
MNKQVLFTAVLLAAGTISTTSGLPASPLAAPTDQPKVIQVVAHKFTFEPNTITLKKGVPVTLQLSSQDVKHGFYIRGLKVEEEIVPGKTSEVSFTPDKAGTFPTICDHFCGLGHKNMNMTVVVEE